MPRGIVEVTENGAMRYVCPPAFEKAVEMAYIAILTAAKIKSRDDAVAVLASVLNGGE